MSAFYDIEVTKIDGSKAQMSEWRGQTLVIVNTARQCGLKSQFAGLEALYQKYKDKGLVVLGFPCNQFAGQEPGTDAEIAQSCDLELNITFPMFSKIDVNGASTHPLYVYLKSAAPGLLGTEMLKWNFTKFLVDKRAEKVWRFAPTDLPEGMSSRIEKIL